ncbi:MAG TPA: exodeoxyribonuclease III, partial [Aliiroseovarius sp.]|nr:exodeoxyribonuclease III [Aliiroseovarius sp.]
RMGLDGDDADDHARYIEATVVGDTHALRICGLYLPNGNPAPGPKFDYKLAWMARLRARARVLLEREEAFVMAGDYNIIPQAEDAARPDAWREDALFRPEARAAFRRLVNLGLTDAFRTVHPEAEGYTFWDFQRGAWNRNDGIRIDHFLLSPQAADMLVDCRVEKDLRGWEKPSDHVPIQIQIDL